MHDNPSKVKVPAYIVKNIVAGRGGEPLRVFTMEEGLVLDRYRGEWHD